MKMRAAVLRSVIQQNATLLISFATGIVIARLLSPAEFGSYSIAMALLFVAMALKDFGIGSYVVSAESQDDGLLGSAYGLSLAMSAALAILLAAGSVAAAAFYGDPVLGQVMRIAAVSPLVLAVAFPATVLMTRALDFHGLLIAGVGGAVVQSLVAIGLALQGFGAVALGWGSLAGSAATAALTIVLRPKLMRVRPSAKGWRKLIGFSGLMSATLAVGSLGVSTPQLLIGKLAGIADAALYGRAQTIVTLVTNGFFQAAARPLLPGLARAEHADGDVAPFYLKIVEAVTGLAWPAFMALSIWASPLVVALYGQRWAATAELILPLAIGQALSLAVTPHYEVMTVKRKPGLLLRCELMAFAFTLAALAALLPFGLRAASWAMALAGLFFAAVYFFALRRVAGFSAGAILRCWARSLALTAAVVPGLLFFRHLHDQGELAFLPALLLAGASAGLSWLAALALTGHELHGHAKAVFGGTRGVAAPAAGR